jgi:lipocalin
MGSLGMWLGSGTLMAGVGAAMVCGAGSAAADTGGDSGSSGPSVHASAASSKADRSARPNPVAAVRHAAATAAQSSSRSALPAAATNPITRVVTQTTKITAPVTRLVAPATAATTPAAAAKKAASSSTASVQSSATAAAVVPSPDPVDPAEFVGTYYEQGSVKQFFSIGLVNTKAVYSLNPDGTIRVQNSGNYFFNKGLRSSIVGSAVPVNATNTELSVSFLPFRLGKPKPPGNYTILAHADDYSWVIVSDPSGKSGYILTRSKTISPESYQQLLGQARSLGVTGNITPTRQFA